MSALYQRLVKQYENGEFDPAEDLVPLDDIPKNFARRVGRKGVGNRQFDAEVIDYVAQRKARGLDIKTPVCVTILMPRLFDTDRPELFEVQRNFLTTYAERQGRAAAFFRALPRSLSSSEGVSAGNFKLLDVALTELRPDDDETFAQELYEVLTYETLDGVELDELSDEAAEELTPGGRIARRDKENTVGRYSEPFRHIGGGRAARDDQKAIMNALFERAPWGKDEWEAFFGYAYERDRLRDKQFRALLRAFQSQHDGTKLLATGESVRVVVDFFEHLQRLPESERSVNVSDELLQSARNGVDTDDPSRLQAHFRARDLDPIRRWHEQGGSFRVYELYNAAEQAFDDREIVEYVLDRYNAEQDQLNTALKRAVRGLAQAGSHARNEPFAAIETLIDAGADPGQRKSSLVDVYLEHVFQSDSILFEDFEQYFKQLQELSARPARTDELQSVYDPSNLPNFGPKTVEALTPLIQLGVYPTTEQLDALQDKKPDLYDQLTDQLPARKQKAEQARQTEAKVT